jgi:hypothetical protein
VDDDVNVKGVSTEAEEANVKPTNRQSILTTEGSNYKRRATGKPTATVVRGGVGDNSIMSVMAGEKKTFKCKNGQLFSALGKYFQVKNRDYLVHAVSTA